MLLPDQTYEQNTTRTKKLRAAVRTGDTKVINATTTITTTTTTTPPNNTNHHSADNAAGNADNAATSITTARGTLKAIRRILTESRHNDPLLQQQQALNAGSITTATNSNANVFPAARPTTNGTQQHQSTNTVSATLRTLFQLTFSKAAASAAQLDNGRNGGVSAAEAAVATPENFRLTADFFNNIPDYVGEPLRPFSLAAGAETAAEAAAAAAAAATIAAPHPQRSAAERRRRRQQRHERRREPKSNGQTKPTAADVENDSGGGGPKDVLKECEEFLHSHRIRPDFFCRYRQATW